MEQEEDKLIVAAVMLVLRNLIYSSESDDEEEVQVIRNPRRNVAKIENYVEQTIPALTTEQFKAHFRYNLLIFFIQSYFVCVRACVCNIYASHIL